MAQHQCSGIFPFLLLRFYLLLYLLDIHCITAAATLRAVVLTGKALVDEATQVKKSACKK